MNVPRRQIWGARIETAPSQDGLRQQRVLAALRMWLFGVWISPHSGSCGLVLRRIKRFDTDY
jgi:hypothetical protein